MKTKYQMQVFEVMSDYEQLTATKCFNSFVWAKRYMSALRARHQGDEFKAQVFKVS